VFRKGVSAEMKGHEPSPSPLRMDRPLSRELGLRLNFQAIVVGEAHRRARKCTVGQQSSPGDDNCTFDVTREIRATAVDLEQWHEREV